jgi:hypothetical protein
MARRNRNRYLRGKEILVSARSPVSAQLIIERAKKAQLRQEKNPDSSVPFLPSPENGAYKAALKILGLRFGNIYFGHRQCPKCDLTPRRITT